MLAVFVHATGQPAPAAHWLEQARASALQSGLRLFCPADWPGFEHTQDSLADPAALLRELHAAAPGLPLVLLRVPLWPRPVQWRWLATQLVALPHGALTAFSNADPALNPFAKLEGATSEERALQLVELLGNGTRYPVSGWPAHCLALGADTFRQLAEASFTAAAAGAALTQIDATPAIPDRLFLPNPSLPLNTAPQLEAHESPRPAAWGELSARLADWLRAAPEPLPQRPPASGELTLHITHSWGGGVAAWVENCIAGDMPRRHLQLRAEGPQSGAGTGQRLSLYAGNELRAPLASWWLQPPIEVLDDHNPQYQAVLEEIRARHAISRIWVSSLVGHSLDALRTGLPTLQILHDHFPTWPLLSIHPAEYQGDLTKALKDRRAKEQFAARDAAAWHELAAAHLTAVNESGVLLATPSASARSIQQGLSPGWAEKQIHVIPHGVPALPGATAIPAKARSDNRLRIVIPGRMQTGKGADLLAAALPALREHAVVYLVGAGRGGQRFFGQPDVHVLLEYQREQLADLLADIGPDFAALLSTVPETFSYTLSEMRMLGIPVLATRVGSFSERIRDDIDGWLFEPSPEALLKRVKSLRAQPATIAKVRAALNGKPVRTVADMLADYAQLDWPQSTRRSTGRPELKAVPAASGEPGPALQLHQAQTGSALSTATRLDQELTAAKAGLTRMQAEIQRRSEWALDQERALAGEIRRRKTWVAELEGRLAETVSQRDQWVADLEARLTETVAERDKWVGDLETQLAATVAERDQWVGDLEAELAGAIAERDKWVADLEARLAETVAERDKWVSDLEARLAETVAERDQWVRSLRSEIGELEEQRGRLQVLADELHTELAERSQRYQEVIDALENQARERDNWLGELQNEVSNLKASLASQRDALTHLEGELQTLRAAHAEVLNSHSWRLTRPLRASRRVLGNASRSKAWNPARWPLLASQFARGLKTLGWRGTLERMQRGQAAHGEPVPVELRQQSVEAGVSLPLELPVSSTPQVSIVIPVYNHLDYTAACLASIVAAAGVTPFEVIVVDDESHDATPEALPKVRGLRFFRNRKNQGFIRSCNRGLQECRGEFVLLLNNDTQVQAGWLERLLETFERFPDAGLVGARLVYPDGRLQECGGLILNDGSGWNYGRLDNPERPEYQYLRETDYCSGAAIVLRTALFRELGGFDERYVPAYYEDTDLAFRVRERGLKVYVQPAATVVHFEGVSSGTDEASGTKRYQAVNREKFLERWAGTLARHAPRIANPDDSAAIRAARDHRCRGRVLVIDAYTPEPDQDSGSVRLVHLLRCLRDLGFAVSFFPDNRAWAGAYTQSLQAEGIECWYHPWLETPEGWLAEHGAELDYVVISRHYIAANYISLLKKYCPRAKFIFDTVDLHYLREQRLAELENSATLRAVAAQTRKSELAMIAAADATLVVSPVEREVLARDAPGAPIFILSNIHTVPGRSTGFAERKDLFFVGGYQHPPNIDAAQWFVEEIWPLVRAELPDVKFHLVGSKAPDSVRALGAAEGVVFHGHVASLEPFLEGCRLSVAPLRYGAGVKGKVNQSMAHGQPVVATPIAVEGLNAEHGRDLLVAADPAAFAAEVVRVYRDEKLWQHISDHAAENVRKHFSVEAARQDLETLFAALK